MSSIAPFAIDHSPLSISKITDWQATTAQGLKKRQRCVCAAIYPFLLAAFIIPIAALAQADVATSTLKGEVTDQMGAAVSGASVSVADARRGVVRTVTTHNDGSYQLSVLPPGTYDLRVEASGFQSQIIQALIVNVGQVAIQDVRLQVGRIEETVNIDEKRILVDTERTQQADTVERREIDSLPNLSRAFTSYVFTLPGIADVAAARVQQSRVSPVPTSGFSVGSGNGRSNYVSIDGGENESGMGSLRIRNLSIEAVQEFQVNRNAFAAEYGFSAGTAINVVTRSGTNNFHGGGYLFYRSEKTAARDPLNTSGPKAPERRLTPGFTLGGPLAKNRAFFFSSFETLNYDITRFRSYTNTPSLLAPTGAQSSYIQTLETGPNASAATRRIASQLRNTLTTTNYPTTMQILTQSEGQFVAPTRAYNWTTRLDYNRTDQDLFTGRFTLAIEDNDLLRGDNVESPANGQKETVDDYTTVGTWHHIFNNSLINQFRFQFAADRYGLISRAPESTLIRIAGLIDYGRVLQLPIIQQQKRYQFDDTLSWTHGTQDFKFGVSYRPIDAHLITELGFGGIYQFTAGQPLSRAIAPADLALLTGTLTPPADTLLTSLQAFNLGLPSVWQQGFGNPILDVWQQNFASFAQVSWRPITRLVLNLGARLNYDGEPEPLDHNTSVSPRLGFAWDPFGKGKTVIRGGFGTFYAPVSLQVLTAATLQSDSGEFINIQSRTLQDGLQSTQALWTYGINLGKLPFNSLTDAEVRAFGIIPAPRQPGRRIAEAAADYDNPYTVQASIGISQQLGRTLTFEIGGLMYHGVHLPIALEANYRETGQFVTVPGLLQSDLFGPRLERIDPLIGQKIIHSSEGNSIYYGLTASLLKKFSKGSQFRISYTYGKALDDVLDFTGASTPYLPTRRYVDRGKSGYDLRHVFTASGSFDTPFKAGPGNRWFERALADITLSPIVTLRDGFPFNLFIGRDVNGDLNTTDRPYHAPRNSGQGDNFYSIDARISKRFYFKRDSDGPSLDLIVEGINLFNRANFLRVNDIVCGTTSQPGFINGCDPKFLLGPFNFKGIRGLPPTAPLAFVTAGPPRQFQFGLKFNF